jgi:ADP-ribosylglycohydrolase
MTKAIWALALAAAAFGQSPNTKLFSKIYGCEAAVSIANAMGASVEGWTYERIEQTYGMLDKFITEETKESVRPLRFGPPFAYHAYKREPGWGEDGMERYRLLTDAILKKGGRVNIEDVTREWIEKIDPKRFGYAFGPQDRIIYDLLKAGLPPAEVGKWALWPGFMGTSKMIVPIGMINAGRPDNAGRDALEITRFKDSAGRALWRDDSRTFSKSSMIIDDQALENAAAIAAGAAEALRPGATVQSVIDAAMAQLPNAARTEVQTVLDWAAKAGSYKEFRPVYQKAYQGKPVSAAIEILGGGLACFRFADGHPREAILYAVNLGRDTDCKAYVAGSLAGALRGIEEVPRPWVDLVEKAVHTDPYTVSRRTPRQAAEGIYQAYLNELRKSEAGVREIESRMPDNQLFNRVYGAEAASAAGSAMAGAREQQAARISQRFGPEWVFQAYKREPGMTGNGMELQRLVTSAVAKKGGRVTSEDVARQWVSDIDPSKFGVLLGPQDRITYDLIRSGMPPWDVGGYAQAPGLVGAGQMMLPVGMVNACRPDEAARDALEIGRIKDAQGRVLGIANNKLVYGYGLEVGAAVAAATAEALRANATAASVVETALAQLPKDAREEVETGLAWVRKTKQPKALAALYGKRYQGRPATDAVGVLSGALACLAAADGRPRETVECAAALGGEAGVRAQIAGGWAGALRGIQAVPAEWVAMVEKEVVADPHTVSRRTPRQAAEAAYAACLNEMRKSKAANAAMRTLIEN